MSTEILDELKQKIDANYADALAALEIIRRYVEALLGVDHHLPAGRAVKSLLQHTPDTVDKSREGAGRAWPRDAAGPAIAKETHRQGTSSRRERPIRRTKRSAGTTRGDVVLQAAERRDEESGLRRLPGRGRRPGRRRPRVARIRCGAAAVAGDARTCLKAMCTF